MVVAQLVERSLPIPKVRNSNPVIGKIYIEPLFICLLFNCIEKTNINKKRPGMANFLKIKRLGALEADKWTCTRIKRLRHMKYR